MKYGKGEFLLVGNSYKVFDSNRVSIGTVDTVKEAMGLLDRGQELVNHPSHYNADPSGIECIEIVRHRNFNIGNAIKYLWRAGLKDGNKDVQDLKKAIWYIEDEIKRLEDENV